MGADVSRVRFDPQRSFAGVVLQQGRVLLDADFNEYVAIVEHRLRTAALDVASFGVDPARAGSAWVPRQTQDGFRITAAAGALKIGRGRMYVDGLVAENHGDGAAEASYTAQPYWPTPAPLPPSGDHLVYLDVWDREITALEDPTLVEQAIGVDTTARTQTAWQVRVLPNIGTATCSSEDADIPGWLDVIAPSAGRLTTTTVDVDVEDDPCLLPPSGGYRGLENQTYRVEIHEGGAPGKATFSWSRDNGSVAIPVVEMVSPTVLRLASVGRDDVLRVSNGDWVEILDDRVELDQRAGEMRKVVVDDAARTITFAPALPAELRPADAEEAAARHLRIRRWDQRGVVRNSAGGTVVNLDQPGATGVITVPASATTEVILEHGVAVSFSAAAPGGRFRTGDHWIFAARSADTSIEVLDRAPPVGPRHRYARLATVSLPDGETDCRRLWPPLDSDGEVCGDCTACVTAESHRSGALTVQAALDRVRERGGTVCLHEGTYDVGDGLRIEGARSVRLRGQGPATVLVARGEAIAVRRSAAVTLERFAVVSGSAAAGAIRIHTAAATVLEQLAVISYARSRDVGTGPAIALGGACVGLVIRDNVLVGGSGIASRVDPDAAGDDQRVTPALAALLRIVDNVVVGRDSGIDLVEGSGLAMACRIEGNDVLARGGTAISALGVVVPGGSLSVRGNRVGAEGAGIVVGSDALIDGNTVNGVGERTGTDGIVVAAGDAKSPPGHVRVEANRVHGRAGTGIALRGAVRSLAVEDNVVSDTGTGIAVEGRARAARILVEGNTVEDVLGEDGDAFGIVVLGGRSVSISANRVARVGADLVDGRLRAGILVGAAPELSVSGNTVADIGPSGEHVGLVAGVLATGPFGTLVATGNSVTDVADDQVRPARRWHALLVQSAGGQLTRFGERRAAVRAGRAAVVTNRDGVYAAESGADHVTLSDNVLTGGSQLATCVVAVDGDVVAVGNQCQHDRSEERTGVLLRSQAITATSNRVRGERSMLVLETNEGSFAAVGNLAAGGTHLGGPGNGLPGPWDALNPTVA